MVHGFPVDEDLTGVGRVRARERVHQRRLPGAVAADEGDDLTRVEIDADVVDGMDAAERHADVADLDERRVARQSVTLSVVAVSVMLPSLRSGAAGSG